MHAHLWCHGQYHCHHEHQQALWPVSSTLHCHCQLISLADTCLAELRRCLCQRWLQVAMLNACCTLRLWRIATTPVCQGSSIVHAISLFPVSCNCILSILVLCTKYHSVEWQTPAASMLGASWSNAGMCCKVCHAGRALVSHPPLDAPHSMCAPAPCSARHCSSLLRASTSSGGSSGACHSSSLMSSSIGSVSPSGSPCACRLCTGAVYFEVNARTQFLLPHPGGTYKLVQGSLAHSARVCTCCRCSL